MWVLLYINWHISSSPVELYETSLVFENRKIPNTSSLDIIYIYIYISRHFIYIYIYIYILSVQSMWMWNYSNWESIRVFLCFFRSAQCTIIHHHDHVVPLARISLTLSHHFSLSFITSARSSGLYPVSSHSCWMYVRAGRPAFARPYVGVHRSTSLMSSSLLLQQCPACLVRLTWMVFMMGGRWPYSWCLVWCCHQDLFNIARSILV